MKTVVLAWLLASVDIAVESKTILDFAVPIAISVLLVPVQPLPLNELSWSSAEHVVLVDAMNWNGG